MKSFPSRRRRATAAALLACTLALAPAHAQLPQLGEGSELSASQERQLGERIARQLYRDPDYLDDAILVEYVERIWQTLLATARTRGELSPEIEERFAWQVLLGKDRSVNAFALPGGWLGLHSGLIAVTTSRDELASVLAHELSHVTQRHISRMVTQQTQQAPWMVAMMILGAMAASKSPQAAGALVTGGQGLAMQQMLNFSRDMEREADRIGFGVMAAAGFEPQGFVSMFEKLQQAGRLNDSGAYPYLRTHPMTTERAADMQARQQLLPRTPAPQAMEHALIAGRARVVSAAGVDGLRALVTEAQSGGLAAQPPARQAGALYAGALASARLREPATATQLLAALDKATASEPAAQRLARLLAAELAQAQQDWPRVLQLVDTASERRPELLLTSQAWIQTGRAREAAQRLQARVATQPRDAGSWQMLAAAYQAQGQQLRSLRAEAEARVAQLDYQAALDRFRAAQDLVRRGAGGGDHIEASIIDTRARQVESLLREQSLER